jgi:hypothetical protein
MNWFQWSRGVAAAFLAAGAASLVLAAAAAHAANGTTMTCSTRTLSSLPLRSNGRNVDIMSLTAQGVPCSKAAALAKLVARALAHGNSIALPGLIGVSTVSAEACGRCAPSTHVSLAFAHGAVNVTLRGVGSGLSQGGGAFPVPSFPGLAIPPGALPAPSGPAPGPTTTV